ncbi:MAG TPA: hypothetical protein VFJ70_06980 [Burkholderiales bacterium]|nr:hypothetical protein [Burkholderiales bacterium]
MTPLFGAWRLRAARAFATVLGMQDAELLQKLKQVEENAWLIFSELPPSGARTRALHVFLDAKELKARLERLTALLDQPGHG